MQGRHIVQSGREVLVETIRILSGGSLVSRIWSKIRWRICGILLRVASLRLHGLHGVGISLGTNHLIGRGWFRCGLLLLVAVATTTTTTTTEDKDQSNDKNDSHSNDTRHYTTTWTIYSVCVRRGNKLIIAIVYTVSCEKINLE